MNTWETLGITLQIALVATLIDFPIALALSWLIVKKRIRGRIPPDRGKTDFAALGAMYR